MTDAELAALKIGGRVQLAHNAVPEQHVVVQVDRRTVYVRLAGGESVIACDASMLNVVPEVPIVIPVDDLALHSLEFRWRALTDNVLVVLKHVMANGIQLDDVIIRVAADDSRASAEVVHMVPVFGDVPAQAVRVATCVVGVDILPTIKADSL